MSLPDWLLLLAIGGYCVYVLRRKKGSCSGDCSRCQGCCKKNG